MTRPAWTPEAMEQCADALTKWTHLHGDLHPDSGSTNLSDMLRQGAASLRRWEALKVGVDEIHAHWSSFHSVAPAAVANVQKLIARLEGERDHE